MKQRFNGLNTRITLAGTDMDAHHGALMTPIYQTSSFQHVPGENRQYSYSRTNNPTREALENAVAQIENGKYATAFSSGVAAMDAVVKLLSAGDEVIAGSDLYGGTYRLFNHVYSKFGIKFHYVDMLDAAALKTSINCNTRLIWIETPSNPLMNITDIMLIASIAQAHKIILCVDSTFASPFLQNPLDIGADIVLHSASKYLTGHSDVIQGCLITNDHVIHQKLKFIQNSCGAIPGPQDCFLALRGIKTLHVRMQRHCENAVEIAYFLKENAAVKNVFWCGFEDHPGHVVAKKQMRGFGGVMSFELHDNSWEKTLQVLSSTRIFTLADSIGGIESMINHPASMSHGALTLEEQLKIGITSGLIRISVGIEDLRDLKLDLENAIGGAFSQRM